MPAHFDLFMRGYSRRAVDQLIAVVDEALASSSDAVRDDALAQLRSCAFPVQMRGYSRRQVDAYIEDRIAELSAPH